LQLGIIVLLTLASFFTIIPAMDKAKAAVDYYDKINLTENPGMFDYLGNDPAIVFQSYRRVVEYFKLLALIAIPGYILLTSLIWSLSDRVLFDKKRFLSYFAKCAFSLAIFFLLAYGVLFEKLLSALAEENMIALTGPVILLAIMGYLFFGMLCLISTKKNFLKEGIVLGFKKIHKITMIYIACLTAIALLCLAIFISIEASLLILILLIIVLMALIAFLRLFLIEWVNELAK